MPFLALLLGCGLRRQELAHLKVEEIVEREGRAVIVDLIGKGGRRRTVAVPFWVKESVAAWTAASKRAAAAADLKIRQDEGDGSG
jgi:integrase